MTQTVGDIGEFELIEHIEQLIAEKGAKLADSTPGVGDDAASFQPRQGYDLLVTCDSIIEGRHYLSEYFTPFEIGKRAMVMNISDIGAMGGKPLYALISLGLRQKTPVTHVEDIYKGFMEELNPFNASIIGGNITRVNHSTMIDITLIGEVERSRKLLRSTARVGDAIMVTGYPGQAAAGLQMLMNNENRIQLRNHPLVDAYIRPVHRAAEGCSLASNGKVNAMIDISDGFLGDLGHICERSRVGAEINLENFPVSESMRDISLLLNKEIYDIVLGNSDDYELIFTCSPEDVEMLRSVISDIPAHEVGRITSASEGIKIILEDGTSQKIKPSGWNHFK